MGRWTTSFQSSDHNFILTIFSLSPVTLYVNDSEQGCTHVGLYSGDLAITTMVVWWLYWPMGTRWLPIRIFHWACLREMLSPTSHPHESWWCPGNKAILLHTQYLPVACGLSLSMHDCSRQSRLLRWTFQKADKPQIQSLLLPYLLCTGCAKGKQNVTECSEVTLWRKWLLGTYAVLI